MNHKESSHQNSDFSDELIGQIFGVYRIVREIGRGGMGVVYLAERADGAFEQEVAIKFVKRGMDTDAILKRFRNERQILATLSHPNVAMLYDGGTTSNGLPYFVMEFVDGEPLYNYCDRLKLNLKERLRIFIQICEAVRAVHQIKVVHRDLKPSNILVKADGTPKLLDFGIAKLLDPELADVTVDPTATQMRMLTPEYASPEQVSGGEITFSSDIYSLGVVLYELLSGHRPYRLKNRAPFEIARVICEDSPESLGESLDSKETFLEKSEVQTLEKVLESRGSNLLELRRELSGELEQIVMNALHKNPDERYQNALEFAKDIELYLKGKRISKQFRHAEKEANLQKTGTLSLAVLPLKLFGTPTDSGEDEYLGIGLADTLTTRLSNVRRLMVRPTSSVLKFNDAGANPFQAGNELGVDYVLEGSIRRAGERIRITVQLLNVREKSSWWAENFNELFTDVLELEDSISEKVVTSLLPKLTGEDEKQLNKRGTNSPEAHESYLRGRYYWNQFTPESLIKSREAFEKAIELDPNYAPAFVALADSYIWGNIYGLIPSKPALAEAEKYVLKAIEIDKKSGEAHATLSLIYQNRKCWTESEKLTQTAINLNPNYVHSHEWYAALLIGLGRTEDGIRETLIAEKLDSLSLRTKTLVSWTFYQARQFTESIKRGQEILDLDKNYPQGHSQIGLSLFGLKKFDEALPYFQKFDAMIPNSALPKYQLCFALVKTGKFDEAEKVLAEIKKIAEHSYVKPYFLALAHTALGKFDKAFEYFEQSLAEDEPWMLWFGTDPMLDDLQNDSRYLDLLHRMNNPLAEKYAAKQPENSADSIKSIAVLPLQLIGEAEKDNEYLAVGLADAMIIRLSKVRRLLVRPTNSILRFAQTNDVFTAGCELEVDFVLCGTLRVIGKRIRISAQLLDIRSNTTLWADKFDEDFTDFFELEDLVAEKVAKLLIPKLTGEEKRNLARRNATNIEAFEAYLQGKYHFFRFTPADFTKAIAYFEKAVEIDENYALPYIALSDCYFTLTGFAAQSPQECFPMIEKMAQKAIELDDRLGESFSNLGMVKSYQLDWQNGEKLLQKGIELNPNQLNGYVWNSVFLTMKGRSEEAIAQSRKAFELDPISGFHKYHYIWTLYHNRRFDETLELVRRSDQTIPDFAHGQAVASWIFRHLGNLDESRKRGEKAVQLSPETPWLKANLAATYAKLGETQRSHTILQKLEAEKTQYVSPFCLSIAYFYLDDREKTLELLNKAIAEQDVWFPWMTAEPQLDDLRFDERFQSLLEKLKSS